MYLKSEAKVYLPVIKLSVAISIILLIGGCGSTKSQSRTDAGVKKLDPDVVYNQSLGTKSKTKQKIYKPKTSKSLEIPPDLITTTDPTVLENIENTEETRILREIVGARVINKDGANGLEVDTSVESAWKTLTRFWSLSGINLVEYNPDSGTMETEWIEEQAAYDENESTFKSIAKEIFSSITKKDTSLDKYRIRFERVSADKSYIHVSHRWIARKAIERNKKISDFQWVELESDQNRVADFLHNIVLIFDDSASS